MTGTQTAPASTSLRTFSKGSFVRLVSVPFGLGLMLNDIGLIKSIDVSDSVTFVDVKWLRGSSSRIKAYRIVKY